VDDFKAEYRGKHPVQTFPPTQQQQQIYLSYLSIKYLFSFLIFLILITDNTERIKSHQNCPSFKDSEKTEVKNEVYL